MPKLRVGFGKQQVGANDTAVINMKQCDWEKIEGRFDRLDERVQHVHDDVLIIKTERKTE